MKRNNNPGVLLQAKNMVASLLFPPEKVEPVTILSTAKGLIGEVFVLFGLSAKKVKPKKSTIMAKVLLLFEGQFVVDSIAFLIVILAVFYVVFSSNPPAKLPVANVVPALKPAGEGGSWFGVQNRVNSAVGPKNVPLAQPELVQKANIAPEKPTSVWEMFIDSDEPSETFTDKKIREYENDKSTVKKDSFGQRKAAGTEEKSSDVVDSIFAQPSKTRNRPAANEHKLHEDGEDMKHSFFADPRQVQQHSRDKNIHREEDYQEEREDESLFFAAPRTAYRSYEHDKAAKDPAQRDSDNQDSFLATPHQKSPGFKSQKNVKNNIGGFNFGDFFASPQDSVNKHQSNKVQQQEDEGTGSFFATSKKFDNSKGRDSLKFEQPRAAAKLNLPQRNVLSLLTDLIPEYLLNLGEDLNFKQTERLNTRSHETPKQHNHAQTQHGSNFFAGESESWLASDSPRSKHTAAKYVNSEQAKTYGQHKHTAKYRDDDSFLAGESESWLASDSPRSKHTAAKYVNSEQAKTSGQHKHTAKHGSGDSFFAGESESWLASDSPRSKHTAKNVNSEQSKTSGQHKHTAKHGSGDSFLAGESESWLAEALPRSKETEKSKRFRKSGGNKPSDDSWFAGETESCLASDKPSQRSEHAQKYQHQQDRPSHYVKPVKRQASGDSWLANSNHESEFFAAPFRNSNQAHHHAAPLKSSNEVASEFFAVTPDSESMLTDGSGFDFLAQQAPSSKSPKERQSFKPKLYNPHTAPNQKDELTLGVKAALKNIKSMIDSVPYVWDAAPKVYSGRGAEGQQEYRKMKKETIDIAREFLQLFV